MARKIHANEDAVKSSHLAPAESIQHTPGSACSARLKGSVIWEHGMHTRVDGASRLNTAGRQATGQPLGRAEPEEGKWPHLPDLLR